MSEVARLEVPPRHVVEFAESFRLRPGTPEELHGICVVPTVAVRCVLVLIHGLGEHSGRYRHVMKALREHGIATVAIDLRGFGRSAGQRGHAPSLDAFLDDVALAVEYARSLPALQGLPLFLFGHSYGGFLSVHWVIRDQPALAGVVLSAPALALHTAPPLAKVVAARVLSRWLPQISLTNGVDPSHVSRSADVVAAYKADPLVHHSISCRMGQFTLDGQATVMGLAPRFLLPVLLLVGGADLLVAPVGARKFHDACGSTDRTIKEYPGLYHEVLNEPEWETVFGDMASWIDHHLAPASS